MQVVVHLSADAAHSLRRGAPTPAARETEDAATAAGARLAPLDPDTADPRAAALYGAEVPDPAAAAALVARLQRCAAVEAAYLKPHDAPP